jgi:hypothetical protein
MESSSSTSSPSSSSVLMDGCVEEEEEEEVCEWVVEVVVCDRSKHGLVYTLYAYPQIYKLRGEES